MSVINTNVSALIAQGALTSNSRAQSTAMQQLSTGLRINGAKDDAAGLAIASKMTSQIRGLDQAVRNANDGISMLQTADGAMTAVSDMLQRMRELSVQASSDTNVSTDRDALNQEFQALTTEIGRVGSTTQWNGMNILSGGAPNNGDFTFQIGSQNDSNQRVTTHIDGIGTNAPAGVAVTSDNSGATQVSTTAVLVPTLGDTYNLSVNGKTYSYTVTAGDMAGANATAKATSVATNMASAFAAQGLTSMTGDASAADGTLVLTAAAAAPLGVSLTKTASGSTLVTGNISTKAGALSAIDATTTALATVNQTRSNLGATINRLTYAADNLSNVSQNTSASRSRVQDTDYAKASTELARTQIISQAATAMLAQANQSQQSVLALLK